MNRLLLALLLALVLLCPDAAMAHRINVFAYAEGGSVFVEAFFSKSAPARASKVEAFKPGETSPLLVGRTDDAGKFSFPIPEGLRKGGGGIVVAVSTLDGHKNSCTVGDDELFEAREAREARGHLDAAPENVAPADGGLTGKFPEVALAPAKAGGEKALVDAQELERLIGRAVAKEILPLKRMLQRPEDGPGLKDVAGGLGWIVGIFGLAACFYSRRPRR